MPTDWFRKTTWSPTDQQDFELRLKRSRGIYNKSQYLRIQACHLQDATPPLFAEALKLLDRVLNEFRDDSQVASALFQKAQCTDALYGFDAALPFYLEGLAFERSHRKSRTSAWLTFPWRVLKEQRRDLHDEALESLRVDSSMAMFPIGNFRLAAAFAIINDAKGDSCAAKSFALDAYKAAGMTHSGFRYHKDLGLVKEIEPWAKAELERILSA